ncbi:hypothetical protein D3C76_37100 [compost metagenome]
MRIHLLAGAIKPKTGPEWADKVKIDLDIQSDKVVNKVTGEVATVPAGITYGDLNGQRVAVFSAASIGGIQLAHSPDFAPGTGDFTLEVLLDADSVELQSADNSTIIPLCMWGTYHAPGQPISLDVFYDNKYGGALNLGRSVGGLTSYLGLGNLGQIDLSKKAHYVFQRKDGVGTIYRNGQRVHTAAYTTNLNAAANAPFRIMSRRGGGTGNVWWRFNGKLIGFRLIHAAIYEDGPTIEVPEHF